MNNILHFTQYCCSRCSWLTKLKTFWWHCSLQLFLFGWCSCCFCSSGTIIYCCCFLQSTIHIINKSIKLQCNLFVVCDWHSYCSMTVKKSDCCKGCYCQLGWLLLFSHRMMLLLFRFNWLGQHIFSVTQSGCLCILWLTTCKIWLFHGKMHRCVVHGHHSRVAAIVSMISTFLLVMWRHYFLLLLLLWSKMLMVAWRNLVNIASCNDNIKVFDPHICCNGGCREQINCRCFGTSLQWWGIMIGAFDFIMGTLAPLQSLKVVAQSPFVVRGSLLTCTVYAAQ